MSENESVYRAPVIGHPTDFGRMLVPFMVDVTLHGLAGEAIPLPPTAVPANTFAHEDGSPCFTVWLDETDATRFFLVSEHANEANGGFVASVRLAEVWERLWALLEGLQQAVVNAPMMPPPVPEGWADA